MSKLTFLPEERPMILGRPLPAKPLQLMREGKSIRGERVAARLNQRARQAGGKPCAGPNKAGVGETREI